MYKAIDVRNGKDIIILAPQWKRAIGQLRVLDQRDILICQGCKQPVRVKAGDIKRWHFAHKHVLNCAYGQESPELLKARASLYEWAVSQFGERVVIEKQIPENQLPRQLIVGLKMRQVI